VIENINLVGANSKVIFDGLVVLWDSFERNHVELSLPRIVENNSLEYRQKYLDLLFELENMDCNGTKFFELFGIKDFNYWDFLFSSEFSFQENNTANKFLKIYAFIEIVKEKNIKSVSAFNIDRKIAKVIEFWCKNNGIKFKIVEANKVKLILRLRRLVLVQYVLSIGDMLKLFLSNRIIISRKNRKTFTDEKDIILLDYFDNYSEDNQSFISGYWGDLPEKFVEKGFRVHYLHFFVKNSRTRNISEAKKIIQSLGLECKAVTHELVESYFSFRVFLKGVYAYARINYLFFRSQSFLRERNLTVEQLNLYPIVVDCVRNNLIGRAAAKNAINLALFQEISLKLNNTASVYYLMENQAWEKAAVYFLREVQIRTIGVIHTFRRFWDFRFATLAIQRNRSHAGFGYIPDRTLVNSASSIKEFLSFGFSQDQIFEVEAIRYVNRTLVQNRTDRIRQSPLRILVIGEYLRSVAIEQLDFLLEAKKSLGESVEFIFRIHPSCDSSILDKYKNIVQMSPGSFNQDLARCDEVLAYSSSTAVIQVLQTAKRVRLYKYPKFLDGTSGLNTENFFSLQDYLDLIQESFNSLEKDSKINDILNTEPTLPKWNQYISDLS
jgi:surface carbohydrate biosynthesis protein (TIGR04326 family)